MFESVKNFIKSCDIAYKPSQLVYNNMFLPIKWKTITRHQIKENNGIPTDLNFELTTRCNSKCTYCARESVIKRKICDIGDMDFKLVKKIVDEFQVLQDLLPKNRLLISPDGLGESLLYPKFFEVVSLLRNSCPNAIIHVNTNGIALNERIFEKLINSGIDSLIVSINAHDAETYKKINGVDKFYEVVENVKELLRLKGNASPSVTAQILDININRKYLADFHKFWKPYLNKNDKTHFRPFNDFGGLISYEDFLQKRIKTKRYPCFSMFSTVMIDKDGFIYPCCLGVAYREMSGICLGNIRESSIKEIYSKDGRIYKLRELHKRNMYDSIDACKNCNSWIVMPNVYFKFLGRWR